MDKIKELIENVNKGHITLETALDDAYNFGYKEAFDKAYEFIKQRTPEDELEQMSYDIIISLI